MSESSVMAEMLERVSLSLELWDPDEETVRQVCALGVKKLVVHEGLILPVAVLFQQAADLRGGCAS